MTSPRRFIPRPVPVEVMGPLTPDNAEEIARWCGGSVEPYLPVYKGQYILTPDRREAPYGFHLLRYPDGSHTSLTPEELDEGWVEEGAGGYAELRRYVERCGAVVTLNASTARGLLDEIDRLRAEAQR